MRKYNAFLNRLLPVNTRRRSLYDMMFSAVALLLNEGWGSLWFHIKQKLKQSFYPRIDSIEEAANAEGKKRLMLVVPTMEMGGAERCAAVLLKHLSHDLIKPELLTIFNRKAFYHIPDDVKVYTLEKLRLVETAPMNPSLSLPLALQMFAKEYLWMENTAFKMAKVIQKRKPSVILSQDYYASILTMLAKKHLPASIKLIVSAHCIPELFLKEGEGLQSFLAKRLFNKADCVIAVSKGVAEELQTSVGIHPEKIAIMYNPLDLEQLQELAEKEIIDHPWFSEEVPIICFVGRLTKQKGLEYLLRAVALARKESKLRCVLIGDGEDREKLENIASQLGIKDDVFFLGNQKNPFKFMKKSTIFVLPSIFEGLPYVLVEALACGCPIVATDCNGGGTAELLEGGKYGLLVPTKDENALSGAILKLLSDRELRERLSQSGLQRAKDFALDSTIKAYEDLILKD